MEYYTWTESLNERAEGIDGENQIIPTELYLNDELVEESLWSGKRVTIWGDENYLEYDEGEFAYDIVGTLFLGPHVVSKRLKEHIELEAPDDVQFLPITIKKNDGTKIINNYFLMIALVHVDCIDLEKTMYKEDKDNPEEIENLGVVYIDRSRIPEHRKIFRLKRLSTWTLVREDLVESLRKKGFLGLDIKKTLLRYSE